MLGASFAVWTENWATIQLFWSVQRLWRIAPVGGLLGLDWVQIQARLALTGRRRLGAEIERLALMEDAALAEMSKAQR